MNNVFELYPNCIPVKGAKKSIICDLQLCRYREIPNLLFDILVLCKDKTVSEIKETFNNRYDKGIDTYLQFLAKGDWGQFADSFNNLPALSLEWDSARRITNAIIDYSNDSSYSIANVVHQLEGLQCGSLQIRFYKKITVVELRSLVNVFYGISIKYIELLAPYAVDISIEDTKQILKENKRIRTIIWYNSPFSEAKVFKDETIGSILFVRQNVSSCENCGVINKKNFYTNLRFFTEAQSYNTCLNRKLSVDVNGQVKNCPSMKKAFGSIEDVSLAAVAEDPEFQKIWTITKDQVSICKDCEYRYVCTDCRAYVEDPNNIYSKPFKCRYNPYLGSWEDKQ